MAPAIISYICCRFEANLAMAMKSPVKMTKINLMEKKYKTWKLTLLVMKLLENSLENSLQIVIMFATIALANSSTSTVSGLQILFTGDVIEFVILSAFASVFTTILGQIKWFSGIKDGFMTMTGEVLIGIQTLLAVVTRGQCYKTFYSCKL